MFVLIWATLLFSLSDCISDYDLSQKPTVVIPPMTEGQQITLTCTAPGLCSGSRPEITWMWRGAEASDTQINGNTTDFMTENLTAVTQRHSSTLTFNLLGEHHATKVTCKIRFKDGSTTEETKTIKVSYVKELKISGKTAVKEGDVLKLTCSVGFPAAFVKWTKPGSNKSLHEEDETQKSNGSASLIIPNMTVEHSGQYICTAKHENTTIHAETTVKLFPGISSSSTCEVQSEVLTFVCISEGFPLPPIKCSLTDSHSEYSVLTTVANHTVKSTMTMSVQSHSRTANALSLPLLKELSDIVKQPRIITAFLIGFLIGIFLAAVIACSARKCSRKKQKRSLNLVENLEMVTTQAAPLMHVGQEADGDGICVQAAAEEGAECAGQSAPDGHVIPKEPEYSDIDFSKMKRKNPTGPKETRDATETEYAEIKNGETEDGEMLGGNEETEVMLGEDKKMGQCMPAKDEGGEEAVLYSSVNDLMDEV